MIRSELMQFRLKPAYANSLAPSGPPLDLVPDGVTSTSVILTWSLPAVGDRNGVIRNYTIVVTEEETNATFTLYSLDTIEVVDSLHPFYHYEFAVAATTVEIGPFAITGTVQLLPDGKHITLLSDLLFCFH